MNALSGALTDFLAKTDADAVLLAAEGGFLISHYGKTDGMDTTTLGALAANSFVANSAIAQLLREPHFNCIYQQGEKTNVFVQSIDGANLIIIIFPANISVGVVKHYAGVAREEVAGIFKRAQARHPEQTLDLVMMNISDSESVFRRKD